MKTALFVTPRTYADWYSYPRLGLTYLKAVLDKAGHDCRIFDSAFHGWSAAELVDRLVRFKPEVLGLSAMTHEISTGAAVAAAVRRAVPDLKVVVGGCHVTALPERTLREFSMFDYGVVGEGERSLVELVSSLAAGGHAALTDIAGLVLRQDGDAKRTPERPLLSGAELESLPYPSFDDHYARGCRALSGRQEAYVMFGSRGCPFRCAFCMRVMGGLVRRRSAQSICDEMLYAEREYGAHTVRFRDEIFLLNDQRTVETLELMIKLGISKRMRWNGSIRVNFVTRELAQLAKRAGCFLLGMGIESGDDEILKGISRGYTVVQARQAVQTIKDAGIALGTFYILGHPNDTLETMQKTADLAVELNTDTIAVGLMVPYPGTDVYEMAVRGEGGYRLLSTDWADYDKYGKRCLEVNGIPHAQMEKMQKAALLRFYVRNRRFGDMLRFAWEKRVGISRMLFHR